MSNCGKANKNGANGFQRITNNEFQRNAKMDLVKVKKIKKRKKFRKIQRRSIPTNLPQVARKKLRNEKFFPSFTARYHFK